MRRGVGREGKCVVLDVDWWNERRMMMTMMKKMRGYGWDVL